MVIFPIPRFVDTDRGPTLMWLPWFLAVGTIATTLFFVWQSENASRQREELRFERQVDQTISSIYIRLDTYINFLVATRAHLMTEGGITSRAFYSYLDQLNVEVDFPGIQGVGFTAYVPRSQRMTFRDGIRKDGNPTFEVFPHSEADESYVITYLHPQNPVNRLAVGFDMFTEPYRREAILQARRTGRPIASAKIRLVQDVGPRTQAGFLIYLSLYLSGASDTGEEGHLVGLIYSAFRADDLLRNILGGKEHPTVDFIAYDGSELSSDALLHDTSRFGPPLPAGYISPFRTVRTIEVAERSWTLEFKARPEFGAAAPATSTIWVLGIGSGVTLLFFATGWGSALAHHRVTGQKEWLRVTLASIGDAVVATNVHGEVLFVSTMAEKLIDLRRDESIGRPLSDILSLVDPSSGERVEVSTLALLIEQDHRSLTKEVLVTRRDGSRIEVELTASSIRDIAGRPTGTIIVLHDISARRERERFEAAGAEVITILAYAPSIDQVADQLVRAICNGLQFDTGSLCIADDNANTLRCKTTTEGIDSDCSFAARTMRNASPEWRVLDPLSHEAVPAWIGERGYKTIISVPLISKGAARGVLNVFSRQELPCKPEALHWLSSLGVQIGQLAEKRHAETRRQAILEGAFDSIVSFDTKGQIVELNEAAQLLFGASREELLQVSVIRLLELPALGSLVHSDITEAVPLSQVIKSVARTPAGDAQPVELTITQNIVDSSPFFTAFIRPISETQPGRSELDIRGEVLHNMNEGVCVTDERGTIIFTNPSQERILGYQPGELIGRHISILFAESSDTMPALLSDPKGIDAEHGQYQGELQARRRDGSCITTFTQASLIRLSGRKYILCVQDDVTDTKQWQSALIESEHRFRTMADSMPVLIWTAGADKRPTWFNRSWVELTGVSLEEATSHGWLDRIHPDDASLYGAITTVAFDAVQPFQVEYRLRRFDGSYRWIWEHGIPLFKSKSELAGYIGSGIDITDRKQAEEDRVRFLESERAARSQLERASKIKDEFLATLSHELRTPLNAILGWAQLIGRGVLDESRVRQGVEVIEKNAVVQAQMINDLLDMSRIMSGKIRLEVAPIDVAALIGTAVETIRPMAQAKGLRIHVQIEPGIGMTKGDSTRLQQVLWNLISNAVRFSKPDGVIDVSASELDGQIRVAVRDYGEGIKPEFLPHVFDRFRQADASTTRKHGGLGLGLSIVKHLVELQGGTVTAESNGLGTGATFTVVLPRLGEATAAERGAGEALHEQLHPFQTEGPALEGVKILAVDDEEDARDLLKAILEEEGAVVTTAESSRVALEAIERDAPDLIVSDISMPEEDGYQFIKRVRARDAHHGGAIPAVALTAFARLEDKEQAIAAGFQYHLAKPIDPSTLVATVAHVAHT